MTKDEMLKLAMEVHLRARKSIDKLVAEFVVETKERAPNITQDQRDIVEAAYRAGMASGMAALIGTISDIFGWGLLPEQIIARLVKEREGSEVAN